MPEEIDFGVFASLKGEFEAEGLSHSDVAAEALFAARNGCDYLVKIGGCEAKGDIHFLADSGITSLVAPMIETPFAMKKYMDAISGFGFVHVGVTIETETAVSNVDEIISAGRGLTDVTIGRTDLTASFSGEGVESARTMDMVRKVALAARSAGLKVTMGGSVSKATCNLLCGDAELRGLLDFVETRKAVMPVPRFIQGDALAHALKLEEHLLKRRADGSERFLSAANARLAQLAKRR